MGKLSDLMELKEQFNLTSKFSAAFGLDHSWRNFSEGMRALNPELGALQTITKLARETSRRDIFHKFDTRHWNDSLAKFDNLMGLERLKEVTKFTRPRFDFASPLAIDKFNSLLDAQVQLSSTLSRLSALVESPTRNLRYLNSALQDHSYRFARELSHTNTWEDADIVSEASEAITAVVEQTSEQVSQINIDALSESIINGLRPLLGKSKSERARRFINELIGIVGLLLAVYALFVSEGDISNRETVEETASQNWRTVSGVDSVVRAHFDSLDNKRICVTTVRLRYSASDSSKVIGMVKEGQQVVVLEIAHKWLLISYIDQASKRPMSGYAYKKYFKYNR